MVKTMVSALAVVIGLSFMVVPVIHAQGQPAGSPPAAAGTQMEGSSMPDEHPMKKSGEKKKAKKETKSRKAKKAKKHTEE